MALFALLAVAVLYAGDYLSARFRLPGNRQALESVDVQAMLAIKQKDGRIEYVLQDTTTETCLVSLFPHLGYTPCWYLRGHARKLIKVGLKKYEPRMNTDAHGLKTKMLSVSIRVHPWPKNEFFTALEEAVASEYAAVLRRCLT